MELTLLEYCVEIKKNMNKVQIIKSAAYFEYISDYCKKSGCSVRKAKELLVFLIKSEIKNVCHECNCIITTANNWDENNRMCTDCFKKIMINSSKT